jgi:hypothetical protein|tara:strand:- start:49 stop:354 length:306 start_codon:yes stop_codon:yes gene_type:complete
MIKKILLMTTLSVVLTGCYMAPLALLGPVQSGFSTASIVQSGLTTGTNYMVKKSTGKTISEHVLGSLDKEIFVQTYLPEEDFYPNENIEIKKSKRLIVSPK